MNVKSLIGLLALVVVLPPSQAFSQVPPHIEFFSPQNSVKNVRQVAVRFSEPMVPFGLPKVETEVFAIDCPEKGASRWADERNWIYDFDRDLPAGTSKEMRDNWCIGYTSKYTVGVWVGNFSGAPMWNVSGMSGAAPIWLEVMNRLHRTESSHAPKIPTAIVQSASDDPSQRNRRAEWFIEGTEPLAHKIAAPQLHHKIVYPADGTVMALDPDIPAERQKVFFEAKPQDKRLRWIVDGIARGDAGDAISWSPTSGKHSAALVDSEQRVVDQLPSLCVAGVSLSTRNLTRRNET